MSTPDALRLADAIEKPEILPALYWGSEQVEGIPEQIAAELRRQHAEIERLRAKFAALRIAHQCMAPACPSNCSDCNHALSSAQVLEYAKRYAWLRERDLNTLHEGGVFAGRTPHSAGGNRRA